MSILYRLDLLDQRISNWIATKSHNHRKIASFLALSGNFQPWIIASLLFFIFGVFMDRIENLVQITLLLVTGIFTTIVKYSIRRKRPREDISAKYIGKIDMWSFPSGHAGRMGALAVILSFYYPILSPIFLLWCIAVCYARVALRIHYFFDVIGGVVIGVIVATVGYMLSSYLANFYYPFVQWVETLL